MRAHLPLPGGSNGDLTLRQQQQRSLFFLFRPVLTGHKLRITIFPFTLVVRLNHNAEISFSSKLSTQNYNRFTDYAQGRQI